MGSFKSYEVHNDCRKSDNNKKYPSKIFTAKSISYVMCKFQYCSLNQYSNVTYKRCKISGCVREELDLEARCWDVTMVVFYFSRRSATKRLESISYAWNRERLTLDVVALVEGESESFGVECIALESRQK